MNPSNSNKKLAGSTACATTKLQRRGKEEVIPKRVRYTSRDNNQQVRAGKFGKTDGDQDRIRKRRVKA